MLDFYFGLLPKTMYVCEYTNAIIRHYLTNEMDKILAKSPAAPFQSQNMNNEWTCSRQVISN